MPIVEIASFPASDAFLADPTTYESRLDRIVNAEGCISLYYGIQIEDRKTAYLVIVWETYEHHAAVINHPDYAKLVQDLKPVLAGNLDIQHVDFNADATKSLTAPTTEIAAMTMKPGVSSDTFKVSLGNLGQALLAAKGCHACIWGESREHTGVYLCAIGWDTVQAHTDAVNEPETSKILVPLFEQANIELKHIHLVKYPKV